MGISIPSQLTTFLLKEMSIPNCVIMSCPRIISYPMSSISVRWNFQLIIFEPLNSGRLNRMSDSYLVFNCPLPVANFLASVWVLFVVPYFNKAMESEHPESSRIFRLSYFIFRPPFDPLTLAIVTGVGLFCF